MITYHNFLASQLNPARCVHCKNIVAEHECEICNENKPIALKYGNMRVCKECSDKEDAIQSVHQSPEAQQSRVEEHREKMNVLVQNARDVDDKLKLSTDIFNAKTVSIIEILDAIDKDDSIQNKPYAKAEELSRRFNKMKEVIFECNKLLIDSTNEQKALQVQLNQIANQLRSEEREKLRISDINYHPKVQAVKVSKIRTVSKKFDRVELARLEKELGMAASTIQMYAVAKGVDLTTAGNMIRKSLNEAKSESK